ncbi:MAG: pilus assembly protein PilM [OM182 bacterium]
MQSLNGFFGRHRRLLIGVDISDTQVRVVSLSKQAGRYRVEGYCIGELADGAVEDGVIGDVDTVALCLERLVERMGLRTHGAALAIKSGAAFTKHVMLDSTLARREIEELMLVEAESSLPYALDEVYLDYAIADGVIAGAARRPQKMLLVACKHDVLDPRVRVAEQARLRVEAVDLESFALQRVLLRHSNLE